MTTPVPLNLINLDYAVNKADIIAFLSNQSIFKDYNFSGSNLNVLVGLLAYNTNKNAFLANMLLSEAFIDSAQLKESVFSQAKPLGYLPRSSRSAKATLQVNFSASGISQPYIIPKGSSFSTLVKNSSYAFTTPETLIISSANNSFSFTTDVYEGVYLQDSYIYNPSTDNLHPSFQVTNKTIDTSSLTVAVINSGTTNATAYTQTSSLLDLTNQSLVYFIQTSINGFYEILFGDGIIGSQPPNNSVIILDYRINNATLPNGAQNFAINFDPTGKVSELINTGVNNPQVITLSSSDGGADAETIESVRFYAPRYFQTQERCIVPQDYEVLLQNQFPEINAINAYGGEDNNPPLYGKVIISVSISGSPILPASKKTQYYKFIKERNPLSIQPVFIDPVYTFIQLTSLVRYNINITTSSVAYIQSLVTTTINNYNNTFLNNFNSTLRLSQLSTLIDNCDRSIISNITTIKAYQKINPVFGVPTNYVINFGFILNSNLTDADDIHNDTNTCLSSSLFYYNGAIAFLEDADGIVQISTNQQNDIVKITDIGTIDYNTGIILLNNFKIDGLLIGQTLQVFVVPQDLDVASIQNTILSIEPSGIQISISPIKV